MGRAIASGLAASGWVSITAGSQQARETAALIRAQVLALTPRQLGLDDSRSTCDLLGVVVDAAYAHGVVSMVVLRDGIVSLSGTDDVACVFRLTESDLRWKCADMLQYAERFLPSAVPATDSGRPAPGDVNFYFVSADGVRAIRSTLEALNRIDERLGVLYFAAQRVMAAVRRMAARPKADEQPRVTSTALESTPVQTAALDVEQENSQCLSVGNAEHRSPT